MIDIYRLEEFAADLAQARRANAIAWSLDDASDVGVLEAYAILASATGLMDDEIRGWKVGRLPATRRGPGLTQRFIGPILSRTIRHQRGPVLRVGVSADRPNAIEAEFLVKLKAPVIDAPQNPVTSSGSRELQPYT